MIDDCSGGSAPGEDQARTRSVWRLNAWNQMLAQGDLIGRKIWRQIFAAIQELNRVTRGENERVN